jgi:hypothetical protein
MLQNSSRTLGKDAGALNNTILNALSLLDVVRGASTACETCYDHMCCKMAATLGVATVVSTT